MVTFFGFISIVLLSVGLDGLGLVDMPYVDLNDYIVGFGCLLFGVLFAAITWQIDIITRSN